ncbi:MAG: hypothetical protein ACTSSP_01010 [Candidatus Asgardarchaeia archaeon]
MTARSGLLSHIIELSGIITLTWIFMLLTLFLIDKIIDFTIMIINNRVLANVVNLLLAGVIGVILLKIIFKMIENYLYAQLKIREQ